VVLSLQRTSEWRAVKTFRPPTFSKWLTPDTRLLNYRTKTYIKIRSRRSRVNWKKCKKWGKKIKFINRKSILPA